METYPINKGIGRSVEFQDSKASICSFSPEATRPFRAVCHPLHGGCQSMDLYWFRRDCRIRSGVADLRP